MAGEVRTLAIILRRRATGEESLLLETLCETGALQAFRLPGILKSRKRSAFYYAPGALCEVLYHSQAGHAIVPRNLELVFSPFSERQEYFRLNTVAEILKASEIFEPGEDAVAVFSLLRAFIENLPDSAEASERHANRFYWELLKLMGLAHEPEQDFAAYDMTHGFLTAREVSEMPDSGFRLPCWWLIGSERPQNDRSDSATYRETIRRFLSGR
ncbi:MAG TPA: recombination protein O N-terminal domain-containing protein [Turneriella sp.]|nr:recombination protein O N-terminal domain-containing protein [Turneriella sp.]